MAPTNMFMHVKFVTYTLLGRKVIWSKQNRNSESRMPFLIAFSNFKFPFIFGILTGGFLYDLNFHLFLWISPIWFSWIASPMLAYITSNPLKNINSSKFITSSNPELSLNSHNISPSSTSKISENLNSLKAIKLLLTDPYIFSIHLIMTRDRLLETEKTKTSLKNLVLLLLTSDPSTLPEKSIHRILNNKTALLYFHEIFWKTAPKDRHSFWN
jgi:membrane glycosyltransferase